VLITASESVGFQPELIAAGPFAGLGAYYYAVILADPPWSYATYSAKGTGRGAVSHYDTMTLAQLAALPVAELAAPDCALLLWRPHWASELAHDLIRAWEFTYKTVAFTWAKPNRTKPGWWAGCGKVTRQNAEQVLYATRGRPRRLHADVRELIIAPRREHSRKPDETRERIERLVAGPYLELFARDSRRNWDVWGAQTGLFDHGHVETRRQPSSLTSRAPVSRP
jgi:N6-adenosine-specific RNA methylase IME4